MTIILTQAEIAILDRQPASTRANGGFQGLLVRLASHVERQTGALRLTPQDLARIQRYAFDYGNGGWESRLRRIFERSLGPALGRFHIAA